MRFEIIFDEDEENTPYLMVFGPNRRYFVKLSDVDPRDGDSD